MLRGSRTEDSVCLQWTALANQAPIDASNVSDIEAYSGHGDEDCALANDGRLGREWAAKILAATFMSDVERSGLSVRKPPLRAFGIRVTDGADEPGRHPHSRGPRRTAGRG